MGTRNIFNSNYHFVTSWRIPGTVDEVNAVLREPLNLPQWWPAVYMDAKELKPGDANGVGREIALYTKGWLPYTLQWRFTITNTDPRRLEWDAFGDFVGRGKWEFEQVGADVVATVDWEIRAAKPLLRYLTPLMRPVFAANHHWAMRTGEKSLRVELLRNRGVDPARLPTPPQPTFARWAAHRSIDA